MSRQGWARGFLLMAVTSWTAAAIVAMVAFGATPSGAASPPRLAWPIAGGDVTQLFGPTSNAKEPAFGGYTHFHTGIDFVGPAGSPVRAAARGQVIDVGNQRSGDIEVGYGYFVVIAHAGGWATLYAHLEGAPPVAVGESVREGDVIGFEGSTGNSTGPHVHFELRQGDLPVDPAAYLTPGLES